MSINLRGKKKTSEVGLRKKFGYSYWHMELNADKSIRSLLSYREKNILKNKTINLLRRSYLKPSSWFLNTIIHRKELSFLEKWFSSRLGEEKYWMCIKHCLPWTTPDLAKMNSSKGRIQRLEAGTTKMEGNKRASRDKEQDSLLHVSHTSFPKWEGLSACSTSMY